MDAVKFLKKYHKLCDPRSCDDCPLLKRVDGFKTCLAGERNGYEERVVEIVEKWSKEQENKMTKEEAIAMIEDDKKRHHDELSGRYRAALTMAIEALEHDKKEIINMKSVFNLSDDLISRQAAIEAVRSYFKDKLDGWPREETEEGYEVYCDMDKIDAFLSDNKYLTKRIDAIPSADRPKWIPVTERLPEIGETVIISGKMKYKDDKDYEYFVDVAVYEPSQEFSTFNDWFEGQDEFEILAWQPLPEPYEETEQ